MMGNTLSYLCPLLSFSGVTIIGKSVLEAVGRRTMKNTMNTLPGNPMQQKEILMCCCVARCTELSYAA
jgi:hypothetical protein